jgi:uncharacterized protein YodC (DUF2158 family)
MKFKIGDVVKHKSHELKMVITIVHSTKITCKYFNTVTQRFVEEEFFEHELELLNN